LSEEFGLKYRWEEEVLHFERPGVNGHLELSKDGVRIVVQLGLLLLPFRGKIEQEIRRNLDELFSAGKKKSQKSF
jgi:putative polyhydroxyalkanoate system protein